MAPSTRVPGVPLQPGMTVRDHTITNYGRKKVFGYEQGTMTMREKPKITLDPGAFEKPSITMSLSKDGRAFGKSDVYSGQPRSREPYVPDYVHLDGKVLRYDSFFKEAVHESRIENYRVRRCLIYFYLLDGSIHISEPKVENSGMPQGETKGSVFLKRQVVPKPDGSGNYGPMDLLVGAEVDIYGRVFRVTDADRHTRDFMAEQGVELATPEAPPIDPYNAKRQAEKEQVLRTQRYFRPRPFEDDLTRYGAAKFGAAATSLEPDRLREFLQNDRKVLRFFLVWDDRATLYGELRPFILHYYLQDDTAEVLEVRRANSGRDPFPAFVKKGKLAKDVATIIVTDAPTTHTTQLIDRSGRVDPSTMHYFSHKDFKVGEEIVIYNRPFFIYGCDEFTRTWYKENMNLDFVDIPMEFEPREPRKQMEVPPPLPLGMGDEIDSLGSFLYLIPQAPRKDLRKMMENDRKLLRFMARLETAQPEDRDRVFVIKVFLADDSIAVFEPPQKNSGMVGGKFLERGFIKNPETGERFEAKEFYTGARVLLNGFPFVIYQADEFTLSWMEAHPEEYPMSDVEYVTGQLREAISAEGSKLEALKASFATADMGGDAAGYVGYQAFHDALSSAGIELHEQPLITLMRHFHINSSDTEAVDATALVRAIEG
mmetsp:Transcript_8615/g.23633  ORF Transcript_8615/g.23633 Transcript_8615/m.23633 type:complete len:655 (+) Transcript_8615:45-2009(+)|eukprot:CAMPEP_0185167812 /NCGR_PEP_ID=MMETSP1139-20130426/14918_1 /TAXON_ID=298111 /ORGANISM="Pavlova sp., Strain CCMP459" /LENGTH=654 /DNA_ID=CAMNT_0027733305 /DNA_START=1 /DNA_END=1965 /DNA_ORIENTATION=+